MMCKDLNDESAKRKYESAEANRELGKVRGERDAMATELEILRARVNLYEKQEAENVEVRRLLRLYQNESINLAEDLILQRDTVIADLEARLQVLNSILDFERRQRYRRNIFPELQSSIPEQPPSAEEQSINEGEALQSRHNLPTRELQCVEDRMTKTSLESLDHTIKPR